MQLQDEAAVPPSVQAGVRHPKHPPLLVSFSNNYVGREKSEVIFIAIAVQNKVMF